MKSKCDFQVKKKKNLFTYMPLALESTSYLLIIMNTFFVCASFVKARYLLKVVLY